ncbi:MAG: STAS domain-containing protein [Chloroflexi bacterium]|nr:STAS domain-containing protein [Chloroflexota bacterium]
MMNFTVAKVGKDAAVAELDGRIDIMDYHDLRQQLGSAIGAEVRRLVVNVAAVKFIDNSGLNALRDCLHTLRRQGGNLALVQVSHQTEMKLKLLQLDHVFPVYQDVSTALQWL